MNPRIVLLALGMFALGTDAFIIAGVLTRLLAGCFAATYTPLAFAVGIELAPPAKRGQALALVVSGLNVATVLGAPLGTWIGEHFGWRLSFLLVAGLAGAAFLLLLLFRLPASATLVSPSLKERLSPITRPRVVLTLLPAFLWNVGVYVLYPYIALLLQLQVHLSDVSVLLACFGLGIVLANEMGGRLSDRFGPNFLVVVI